MRLLWLPILLVLAGCSIVVPWSLPTGSPAPTGEPAVLPKAGSEGRSVVRLSGQAPTCGRKVEETGFVYAPQRVVTTAQALAGATPSSLAVTTDDGEVYPARVVAFDPDVNAAVLYVPDLPAPPLPIAEEPTGPAQLIGYPKDAEHAVAQPIKIKRTVEAHSQDLYYTHQVTRTVLMLSADSSVAAIGGPLVVPGGTVVGMVFARATQQPADGFALVAEELLPITKDARAATKRVSTRQCEPDRRKPASA